MNIIKITQKSGGEIAFTETDKKANLNDAI